MRVMNTDIKGIGQAAKQGAWTLLYIVNKAEGSGSLGANSLCPFVVFHFVISYFIKALTYIYCEGDVRSAPVHWCVKIHSSGEE